MSPAPARARIEPAPPSLARIGAAEVASFRDNGFVHLPGFFDVARELQPVIDEIACAARRICPAFDFRDPRSIEALEPERRSALYKLLRYLPALMQAASGEALLEVSRALGLAFPMVLHSFNIRMDAPHRDEFLFHWHQDVTYLLGSLNSVTYWIPLGEVDERRGSVELVPGSHKGGLRPFRYTSEKPLDRGTVLSPADIHLVEEPTEPGHLIVGGPGDLVAFSQFILHRSTPNRSRETRWTVQVRHADAFEPEFLAAGYPCGDATNVYHTRLYGEFARS